MPILVKDYQWSETKEHVYVNVPLKGVKSSKADLFSTDEFIKVSFPPFLFEAVLYDFIDDEKSSVKIREGCVGYTLVKKTPGIWSSLISEKSDDKAFVLRKKQEAVEYARKKTEEQIKENASRKNDDKKYSLKEMMKLEQQDRSRIEDVKESERTRAMKEFAEWKKQKQVEAEKEKLQMIENKNKGGNQNKIVELSDSEDENQPTSNEIFEELKDYNEKQELESEKKLQSISNNEPILKSEKKVRKAASGPRKVGNIAVKFTPRVFPTPQRESKVEEENEWLQKQADARKRSAIDDPDLAEHEKDPMWLKDKGSQLYAAENYLGAINAYSLAIKIQSKMPILYINRAACHLKLRNLYKCAEDCSTALDFMKPEVQGNAKGRLKAHLRRAAAFCELELYVEALQDYEAALKIDPKNETLIEDAKKLRTVIQSGV